MRRANKKSGAVLPTGTTNRNPFLRQVRVSAPSRPTSIERDGFPTESSLPQHGPRQADLRWGHGVLFPHRHGENKAFFTDRHVCINPSKFCVLIRVTRKTRMIVGLQATRTRKMEAVYNLQPHRYDRHNSIYPTRVSS